MQTGTVTRSGRGWRGLWQEKDGEGGKWKRHSTETFARKGEARAELNRQLDRIALGDRYRGRSPCNSSAIGSWRNTQHPHRPSPMPAGGSSDRWRCWATHRQATSPQRRYSGS